MFREYLQFKTDTELSIQLQGFLENMIDSIITLDTMPEDNEN